MAIAPSGPRRQRADLGHGLVPTQRVVVPDQLVVVFVLKAQLALQFVFQFLHSGELLFQLHVDLFGHHVLVLLILFLQFLHLIVDGGLCILQILLQPIDISTKLSVRLTGSFELGQGALLLFHQGKIGLVGLGLLGPRVPVLGLQRGLVRLQGGDFFPQVGVFLLQGGYSSLQSLALVVKLGRTLLHEAQRLCFQHPQTALDLSPSLGSPLQLAHRQVILPLDGKEQISAGGKLIDNMSERLTKNLQPMRIAGRIQQVSDAQFFVYP
mmetsp:Transcript_18048/g.39891  ORF Transcript_18048/g.39891 Transcript_18048/m.39891 type:complete len:267 (+) Transcript_18048:1337-2137(+)